MIASRNAGWLFARYTSLNVMKYTMPVGDSRCDSERNLVIACARIPEKGRLRASGNVRYREKCDELSAGSSQLHPDIGSPLHARNRGNDQAPKLTRPLGCPASDRRGLTEHITIDAYLFWTAAPDLLLSQIPECATRTMGS